MVRLLDARAMGLVMTDDEEQFYTAMLLAMATEAAIYAGMLLKEFQNAQRSEDNGPQPPSSAPQY